MNTDKKTEEFYKKLKKDLAYDTLWPADYLFKFIVPSDQEKVKQVEDAFNNLGAVITTKDSSKGNFTSLSILVRMENPDAVIEKYKMVSGIEGIISL